MYKILFTSMIWYITLPLEIMAALDNFFPVHWGNCFFNSSIISLKFFRWIELADNCPGMAFVWVRLEEGLLDRFVGEEEDDDDIDEDNEGETGRCWVGLLIVHGLSGDSGVFGSDSEDGVAEDGVVDDSRLRFVKDNRDTGPFWEKVSKEGEDLVFEGKWGNWSWFVFEIIDCMIFGWFSILDPLTDAFKNSDIKVSISISESILVILLYWISLLNTCCNVNIQWVDL